MKRSYRFIGGPWDQQVREIEVNADLVPPAQICMLPPQKLALEWNSSRGWELVADPPLEPVTYYCGKRQMGGVAYTCRPEDIAEIFDSGSSGPPS